MRAESDAARYTRATDAIENSAMKIVDFLVIAAARVRCSCQGGRDVRHQLTPSHSTTRRNRRIIELTLVDALLKCFPEYH